MMSQSEKQELDEAEEDPDDYFDPESILCEVWNQIFKNNSTRDLLNLSLVCKTFNESIGSSPEAMDKILLKLDKSALKDIELILNSPRIYKNLRLERIQIISDMKICSKIFERFGENVRTLEFSSCLFTEEEFYNVLEKTQENLEALTICGTKFVENPQNTSSITPRTLELRNLQRLKIRTSSSDSIQKLIDYMPETLVEVAGDFLNDELRLLRLLEKQRNLKNLSLWPMKNTEFLKKIDCATINFKLEKLQIGYSVQTRSCANFEKFLKSQAESLKELKLVNVSVSEFHDSFKDMPNLESLEFVKIGKRSVHYDSGPIFNCPALKTLIIDFKENSDLSYFKFFKRFPNIQEIVLKMRTNSKMIRTIAKNHPALKKLVISKFDDNFFNAVSFKYLTTLEIGKVLDQFEYDENYVNEALEISFENSIYAMQNLETLKLSGNILVTEKALLQILNFIKLKHLEIMNGSRLSDDLLNKHSELLKKLQVLEISNMRESAVKA